MIQEIKNKKPNTGGAYREYEVHTNTITRTTGSITFYSYGPNYSAGRFERPHLEAYRISIHESYREGGRVKKKQCVVGTIGYYSLIDFGLYDYIEQGILRAMDMFHTDFDTLYELVEAKIAPIKERIIAEYHGTEEYQARRRQETIQKAYQKAKAEFGKRYDVDPHEYDYCYNALGELMNQAYLDHIVHSYQRKQEAYRSYQTNFHDNYSTGGTYTERETALLKQFYRTLSKSYHPDLNPEKDTTAEMQLLNKLKEAWGV